MLESYQHRQNHLTTLKMNETKVKQKCAVCKEDANFVCSSCLSVPYCSVAHQKKHWNLHKSACVFFNIKNDRSEFTGAGKCCVASRDLKAGVVILEELPIFQMPSDTLKDRCCCITCGLDLPPKNRRSKSNSCHKCKWPVCGTECAEFPLHANNECKIFVANEYEYPKVMAESSKEQQEGRWGIMMRVYALMVQNPEWWKEVLEMLKWNEDKDIECPSFGVMSHHYVAKKIASALPHYPKIFGEDQDLLFWMTRRFVPLLLTQGYGIRIQDFQNADAPGSDCSSIPMRIATYVYKTARHFVHSCSPNCVWTVGTFPDFKMQIRTSVGVKKGEKLTVSRFMYDADFSSGTRFRQKIFQDHFHAACRCKLCLDPTEFGTFQSAVACKLCSTADGDAGANSESGFLLPIDPLNIKDDAPWRCIKCKKITTATEFCGKLEELIFDLQKSFIGSLMPIDKVCEAFIQKYRNKLVHPNHWLIQGAVKLIRYYHIQRFELLDTKELLVYEKHMRFLVDQYDKTTPGIIQERIVFVSSLSHAMCRRLLNSSAQDEFQRKSKEDLLDILAEVEKCQQYLNEALLFFKHLNIQRGRMVDIELSNLRSEKQFLDELKSVILSRLAEIEFQRLRLGVN